MTSVATRANSIAMADGTQIYYKDWGSGQPVVFSHGWPLTADMWDGTMLFLASNGYRCIAHDRRGHGRSTQPWNGNDMDTYAEDLSTLMNALDVRDAVMIGHSTGGGELTHYIGRYGTGRVSKIILVSAIPPLVLKTDANPEGTPKEALDGLRAGMMADRAQVYREMAAGPFFGFNRPGAKVSQGLQDSFWLQSMMGGHANQIECTRALSETDFTEDLKRFDVPTLIVHGSDDQIVPIAASAHKSSKLVPGAVLKVYEGAPHGIPSTHAEQLNRDILEFIRG